jgi:hypothetical protein
MSELAKLLTVPFAAGFIVQRLLEIVDPFTTAKIKDVNIKKTVIGGISLVLGWAVTFGGCVYMFGPLLKVVGAATPDVSRIWDQLLTGIFISAGTEGFNTLMKFANYKKEASKADAADKKSALSPDKLASVNAQS